MVNLSVFLFRVFRASAVGLQLTQQLSHIIAAAVRRSIMFVFRKESLPRDPVFPANLKQLGYGHAQSIYP